MKRTHFRFMLTCAVLAPACLAVAMVQPAQAQTKTPAKTPAKSAPATTTKAAAPAMSAATQAKIKDAMSAGPTTISKNATIMDWGADPMKDPPKQLRAGTNGWVCYPSMPMAGATPVESPMCIDKAWQGWAEALMSKTKPNVTGAGVAYMLRGDGGASNLDPYATGPTADNQWVVAPAHIMLLYADPKMLDAFPTDPKSGGPWVMWKGTPYAHVMVPVSGTAMATMPGMSSMPAMKK